MSERNIIPKLRSFDVPAPGLPQRVTVLRGLPGSGKSTAALAIQKLYPEEVLRINNDDISRLLLGASYLSKTADTHSLLANLRRAMLIEGLQRPTVRLIIIDNTNLVSETVAEVEALAVAFGAEFIVEDEFLKVSVEECIKRDSQRSESVGKDVILRMSRRAKTLTPWTSFRPVLKSKNNEQTPVCFIIDLDPILRWLRNASVSDWMRIYKEKLPSPAIELAKAIKSSGAEVIGVTSLSEKHFAEASVWSNVHVFPGIKLFMKEYDNDGRSAMSKYLAYDKHIKPHYNVAGVIGEKSELVHVWKNIAQLPTFEVSFGDF